MSDQSKVDGDKDSIPTSAEAILTAALDPILGDKLSTETHPEARAEYERIVRIVHGIPTVSDLLTYLLRRLAALKSVLEALESAFNVVRAEAMRAQVQRFWTSERIELFSEAGRKIIHEARTISLAEYIAENTSCLFRSGVMIHGLFHGNEPKCDEHPALFRAWTDGIDGVLKNPVGWLEQAETIIAGAPLINIDRARLMAELARTVEAFPFFPFRNFETSCESIADPLLEYLEMTQAFLVHIDQPVKRMEIWRAVDVLRSHPTAVVCSYDCRVVESFRLKRLAELNQQGTEATGVFFTDEVIGCFIDADGSEYERMEHIVRIVVDQRVDRSWPEALSKVSGFDQAGPYQERIQAHLDLRRRVVAALRTL